ncbi:MAG: hypothetical protein JOY96_04270 [Verrucomicrobia bacterium]|nr:hypothetical protein [Verrucomicrobiota bacterium]
MRKLNLPVKEIVELKDGGWGIVLDFVLEDNTSSEEELLVNYRIVDDLSETDEGYLVVETLAAPTVKQGDSIEVSIQDRQP